MTEGRHHVPPRNTRWRRFKRHPAVRPLVARHAAGRARVRRIKAWTSRRGRQNLVYAVVAAFIALMMAFTLVEDQALYNALRARGVRTDAVVSEVLRPSRGSNSAEVEFRVDGRLVNKELAYSVGSDIEEGQRVHVIYDPRDPSQVVLPSQLGHDRIVWDYAGIGAGAVGVVALLVRWWIQRRGGSGLLPRRWSRPGTGRHAAGSHRGDL